jgi:hypothetical protein
MDDSNILSSIPGEHVARGTLSLPAAQSAPDAPPQVVIALPPPDGRRVRITYRRFKHKRARTTLWFWTAVRAEIVE